MGTYDTATATARRILSKKGGKAVITRGTTIRDIVTQAEIGGSVVSIPCVAVGLPPGKGAEKVLGTLVDRNIQQFYISTQGAQPQPGDNISWAGADWNIVWTATYDPAADGAIFTEAYGER